MAAPPLGEEWKQSYYDMAVVHKEKQARRMLMRELRVILIEQGLYEGSMIQEMDFYGVPTTIQSLRCTEVFPEPLIMTKSGGGKKKGGKKRKNDSFDGDVDYDSILESESDDEEPLCNVNEDNFLENMLQRDRGSGKRKIKLKKYLD
jgi:hypothetical protein